MGHSTGRKFWNGDEQMKPTVYIETTVISYHMSRASRDLIIAAHQQITHDWWELALPNFEAFTSPIVMEVNLDRGIRTPIICTPEEIMEV